MAMTPRNRPHSHTPPEPKPERIAPPIHWRDVMKARDDLLAAVSAAYTLNYGATACLSKIEYLTFVTSELETRLRRATTPEELRDLLK